MTRPLIPLLVLVLVVLLAAATVTLLILYSTAILGSTKQGGSECSRVVEAA